MRKLVDREIVEHAQAQERFLTDSEMQEISAFFQRVSASLAAAQKLRENSPVLVKGAAKEVFRAFPHYSESCTNEERIKCTRDIEFCLRLITYGLVTNSTDQMDELTRGLSEIFRVFKLEPQCLLVALEYFKSNHGLIDEEAREANIYIDHLSNVIRAFESESRMNVLRRLQEYFAKLAPGVSLADELIAERREEARRELDL
jgi:Phycobilisome protein